MSDEEKIIQAPPVESSPFSLSGRQRMNVLYILLGDLLALSAALTFGGLSRMLFLGHPLIPGWSWAILPIWFLGGVMLDLYPGWGIGPVEQLRRISWLVFSSFALVSTVLFLTQTALRESRFTLTAAFLSALVFMPLLRAIIRRQLIQRGLWGVPVVVYGTDDAARHAIEALRAEPQLGYNPTGIFDDESPVGETIDGIPVWGRMDAVPVQVPVAIVATQSIPRERLIHLLEGALAFYPRVILLPDLLDAPSLWAQTRDFAGLVGLEITPHLQHAHAHARRVKRITDTLLLTILAPIWLPLLGVLLWCVWREDRGHPFFVWHRVGLNGQTFPMLKFRTMPPGVEEKRYRAAESDANVELLNSESHWTHPDCTAIGRFLRRTSLDDLPQLFNVWRGEMSLVGPRPISKEIQNKYNKQACALRTRMRPGITGMTQVMERKREDTEKVDRLDTYYIRNWSIWLDLVILARTFRAVRRSP